MSEFLLVLRDGGFAILLVVAWFALFRQRDVLETVETAARMLAGTLLVVLLLAYYTTMAGAIFLPAMVAIPPGPDPRRWWTLCGLAVLYLLPLLASLASFLIQPRLLRRRLRLRPLDPDDPLRQEINTLAGRLGLRRRLEVCWAVAPFRSPVVFQALFRRPTLVLPVNWAGWGRAAGPGEETAPAVRRFVLLHELAHVRNRDVLFMTWAGAFLAACRFWLPLLLVASLALLPYCLGDSLAPILYNGVVAAVVIYPLLRLLYLSVSRERELLADARAQLYLDQEGLARLLKAEHLFEEAPAPAAPRRGLRQAVQGLYHLLVRAWSPMAVLPAVPVAGQPARAFLRTHPPAGARSKALRERTAIQSQVGASSLGAALWVGVIVGVFYAFIFVPFILGAPESRETLEMLVRSGGISMLLYPVLALCLPLRNVLSYFQPLGRQVGSLLLSFAQAGVAYVLIMIVGYGSVHVAFQLQGVSVTQLTLPVYLDISSMGVTVAPFLALLILIMMRMSFRLLDDTPVAGLVWLALMAVTGAGVLTFPIAQFHRVAEWTFSHMLLRMIGAAMAAALVMLILSRFIAGGMDFRHLTSSVRWRWRRRLHVWRHESSSPVTHMAAATLSSTVYVIVVVLVPGWAAVQATGLLSRWLPFEPLENTWGALAILALLLALLAYVFERVDRVERHYGMAIARTEAFLRDAGWLVETGKVLGLETVPMPAAVAPHLPAELLTEPADAPSIPWWLTATTVETLHWASTVATGHSGPGALSMTAVEYAQRCAAVGGGFGLWPGGRPRLGATSCALRVLSQAGRLDLIDADEHGRWIAGCQESAGGFRSPEHRRPNMEDTEMALLALGLLGQAERTDRARCAAWVEPAWLRSDRRPRTTRQLARSLAALGAWTPDLVALLENSWLLRYRALVLSLRVDKQIELVRDYVLIVSSLFPQESASLAYWTEGLAANVSEGWASFLSTAGRKGQKRRP